MSLFPFVSKAEFDLVVEENVRLRDEIARQREANERLVASHLAARGIPDPYRPTPTDAPARPIGRLGAERQMRRLAARARALATRKSEHDTN